MTPWRARIEKYVESHSGSLALAAEDAGVNYATMRRWLKYDKRPNYREAIAFERDILIPFEGASHAEHKTESLPPSRVSGRLPATGVDQAKDVTPMERIVVIQQVVEEVKASQEAMIELLRQIAENTSRKPAEARKAKAQ